LDAATSIQASKPSTFASADRSGYSVANELNRYMTQKYYMGQRILSLVVRPSFYTIYDTQHATIPCAHFGDRSTLRYDRQVLDAANYDAALLFTLNKKKLDLVATLEYKQWFSQVCRNAEMAHVGPLDDRPHSSTA
jgi:hypothetical protein